MQTNKGDIGIFLAIVTIMTLLLSALVVYLIYLYRKRQLLTQSYIANLHLDHDKILLAAQLEMQETTLQQISREIHDNISLSLSLAKLHLNTLEWNNIQRTQLQVALCIEILSDTICNLSDISRTLNSDIIANLGLIAAVEKEVERINKTRTIDLSVRIEGDPVYLNSQTELVIFRIIQESLNNILKHSHAKSGLLTLRYSGNILIVDVADDGVGLHRTEPYKATSSGLKNIKHRLTTIGGDFSIKNPRAGAHFTYKIPY